MKGPEHPHKKRLRGARMSLGKKALFALLSLALILVLVEIGLWAAGVQTLTNREDPTRGFSGLVSVFRRDGDVYRTRQFEKPTFNDESFLARKSPNGLRLFCLGGSSAFGFPWDGRVAFPAILEQVLARAHPNRHVEAVNVAGISYAMHRLRIVANEIINYEPDIVVIYSGHNEFIEPAYFNKLKRRSPQRNRLTHLAAHWRLYSLAHSWRRQSDEPSTLAKRLDMFVERDEAVVYTEEQKSEIVAQFRQNLRHLIQMVQARGVTVVVATVPCNLRQWQPQKSMPGATLDHDQRLAWASNLTSAQQKVKAGQAAEAVTALRRALAVTPFHAHAHYMLAKAYESLHMWDDARQSYQRACDYDASPIRRLSPINDAIREITAEKNAILVEVDRFFEEQSELGLVGLDLIEDYVHPTPDGHEMIAWLLWEAIERSGYFGRPAEPIRTLFDEVIAQRPPPPTDLQATWFFNQGYMFERQGRVTEAIERYRRAIEITPDTQPARVNLARLLGMSGNYEEVVRILEPLIHLTPTAELHNNMGLALRGLGRIEDALRHFKKAIAVNPDFAGPHVNLATTLLALRRPEEAIRHLDRALAIDPNLVMAHGTLGSLLAKEGQLDEAMFHYRQAIRIAPEDAELHFQLARVLQKHGRIDEAEQHYREAVQHQPDFAGARNNLAVLLQSRGKLDEAIAQFRQALAVMPNMAGLHNNLGAALLEASGFDEAIQHFHRALELTPNSVEARANLKRAMSLKEGVE